MSIKENAIELIAIVVELCNKKGLDIKDINKKKDAFEQIWEEAVKRYDYINKNLENYDCEKCKKYEDNIKNLELVTNSKKRELVENENKDVIGEGVVIGLEMALAIIK